jgi:signal recognition particle subunit SRP54
VNDKEIVRSVAILDSMTDDERRFPLKVGNSGSRKRRISKGAGTDIQHVNRVLKQHEQMQKMMKKMSGKGGMASIMRGLQGRLPPGLIPPQ